jgi:hypothetical protein
MNPETVPTPRTLIRDVLMLQLKLLLDTLRDLALSPLTLAAAALDLLLSRFQPPRYFYAVLRLGERSEEWIDLWSAARGAESTDRENVDALLVRVEEVVRDPKTGARRARILKRWAERQVARARQQIRPPADDSPRNDRQDDPSER